jgi:hypothetical protein
MKETPVITPVIPEDIQEAVDEYVPLHKAYKEMEAQLKKLRKQIEPFMEENSVDLIMNTDKTGSIALVDSNMAIVTAQYTSYSTELLAKLGKEVVEMVAETVVNKDKLEAMVSLGAIEPEVIKPYRQFKAIRKFTVKK